MNPLNCTPTDLQHRGYLLRSTKMSAISATGSATTSNTTSIVDATIGTEEVKSRPMESLRPHVAWSIIVQEPSVEIKPLEDSQMTSEIRALQYKECIRPIIFADPCSRSSLGVLLWYRRDDKPNDLLWPHLKQLVWTPRTVWVKPVYVGYLHNKKENGLAAIVQLLNEDGFRINWGAGPTLPERYIVIVQDDIEGGADGKRKTFNISLQDKPRARNEQEAPLPDEVLTLEFVRDQMDRLDTKFAGHTRPWIPVDADAIASRSQPQMSWLSCCNRTQLTILDKCSKCKSSTEGSLRLVDPFVVK